MKRFLLLATAVAFLAAGCQKTEVENEVLTPIGFSAKVGKQSKAIAQNNAFDEKQPFGVFTYSFQTGTKIAKLVMPNDRIQLNEGDWEAKTIYYWPNDPRTSLDFYAYSPFYSNSVTPAEIHNEPVPANHQILNGTLNHIREYYGTGNDVEENLRGTIKSNTLKLEGYTHSNMYVDFMVADAVRNATYSEPDGVQNSTAVDGVVPVQFRHQMTQLNFTVTPKVNYSNIKFTVESIVMNGINNTATYTNNYKDTPTWNATGSEKYTIFPAKALSSTNVNGSPALEEDQTEMELASTSDVLKTAAVTMIPQSLTDNQTFTITYRIEGTGVAEETVIKTLKFKDVQVTKPEDATAEQWAEIQKIKSVWAANKKIIYNLAIGLNEITFTPSVTAWDPTQGSYDITPSAN